MKLLSAVLSIATLSGCTGMPSITQERQEISSAHIGCAAADISIVNSGSSNWEATCKGKTFYCTVAPKAMCTVKM